LYDVQLFGLCVVIMHFGGGRLRVQTVSARHLPALGCSRRSPPPGIDSLAPPGIAGRALPASSSHT
jgi:hypothetical protein